MSHAGFELPMRHAGEGVREQLEMCLRLGGQQLYTYVYGRCRHTCKPWSEHSRLDQVTVRKKVLCGNGW